MVKLENKTKENPKLEQNKLLDGRICLYLEYYLGREEKPVLDENGNQMYYDNGKTVASFLRHSGLKHTEKYTRAVDKLKEEAINSLPELKF